MITPGSTVGILGGGQLGRMLVLAGRNLGYRFHVFEPKKSCPAGMVADLEINAAYSDKAALRKFAWLFRLKASLERARRELSNDVRVAWRRANAPALRRIRRANGPSL
ncbi:MAG: hypothetical protein VXU42_01535, partial [Verrucomicrobiota bacterium]|nr:hypothetical protein [Verrucomicrobiota bacterium]